MRRINSEFRTKFISEEGQKLANRDYFGYVEMDDFACYVLADSLDGETAADSAQVVVESIIRSFGEGPTLSRRRLNRYIQEAHRELRSMRGGMHLKASVVLAVTDYRSMRCCHVGNCRLYLLRNSRFLLKTRDQSLARNLLDEGKIPLDAAAAHEERNNLYSYLGGRERPKPVISKKLRLEDGDILELMTRGVWENCTDAELLEASQDAKEPEEILNRAEDRILGRQEERAIDNYSLAVTFVDKIYRSPKKKVSLRQVLMVAIPLILLVGGISLALFLRHRSRVEKETSLAQAMESGETYLRYDNYAKAAEEYRTAKSLSQELKEEETGREADQYIKLAEQIILADEAMGAEEYQKAQELYLTARELSAEAGNVGKNYIDDRLEETKNYMEVYDLIELGAQKEKNGNLEGAAQAYGEARDMAASLYYGAGKEEALARQAAVEEELDAAAAEQKAAEEEAQAEAQAAAAKERESQAAEQELENQQKANDQQNAIDLENKGNEFLAQGQYESAVTYYRTAQAIYIRLELAELADGLNAKIEAARAGAAAEQAAAQAEQEALSQVPPGQGISGQEENPPGPGGGAP